MSNENSLHNITVNSPCLADWDQMTGNDQIRFCSHCNLQVNNISELTYSQAARLVARSKGRLCVRYYRDAQGAPVIRQAPVALHQIARRVSRFAAGAFSATLSLSPEVAHTSPVQSNAGYSEQANPDKPQFGSTLVGTITDTNGAVVAGASIVIANDEGNFMLFTSTNNEGTFRFDGLAAGVYSLRITAPGFAPDQTAGVYVGDNTETRLDRSLNVAGIEAEVNVGSSRQTESVTVGVVAFVAPEDPMIKAAQEDNLQQVQELLPGRNVNLRDQRSGTTALEHAVRNGNREMTQLLLSAGADVNMRNPGGQTVLMMLGEEATTDLVWDLVNTGAKVNQKDNEGNTPLIEAAGLNNIEVLKTLLDAGAEIAVKNDSGETPLMMAASGGLVNNVRALVLAGADINQRDSDQKSALSFAIENNHAPVIRLLRSRGALEMVAQVKDED